MASIVNVGIIGAGRIGKLHAENIALSMPQAKLVAIADVNMTPAIEAWAKGLGVEKVLKDPAALVADKGIQAVLICSSTDTHADFVVKLADAGKHIFCEKPVDLTTAKVRAALAAVKKANVKLQVGFNRRFDHNFRRVRDLVEAGAVGTPQIIKITSRDPSPPPPAYVAVSGGIFLDMTIHDFDMARFLIGDEVEEIYTAAGVMVDPAIGEAGDLDTALLVLSFRNGVIGTIDNCRQAAYGYDQRAEILGSAGSIATQNCYPNQATISTGQSVRRDLPLNFFMERYTESFATEVRSFVQSVVEDTPTAVTGLDGRIPVVMGLAARKSYDERRAVKLSEIQ